MKCIKCNKNISFEEGINECGICFFSRSPEVINKYRCYVQYIQNKNTFIGNEGLWPFENPLYQVERIYIFGIINNIECTWDDGGWINPVFYIRWENSAGLNMVDKIEGLYEIDKLKLKDKDCSDLYFEGMRLIDAKATYNGGNIEVFMVPRSDGIEMKASCKSEGWFSSGIIHNITHPDDYKFGIITFKAQCCYIGEFHFNDGRYGKHQLFTTSFGFEGLSIINEYRNPIVWRKDKKP